MKKNSFWKIGLMVIIYIAAVTLIACGDGGGGGGGSPCDENCLAIGAEGKAGGKIIYHKHSGFTVKGYGNPSDTGYFATYTAYYLEAAPSNQGTNVTWCTCTDPTCDLKGVNGTAIGTGRANTAAIINHTAHTGNTTANNAAKATNVSIGEKSDWFLPSKDELNEMYKAGSHLGIYNCNVWSSSQYDRLDSSHNERPDLVWWHYFRPSNSSGHWDADYQGKIGAYLVRAVRAF